MGQDIATLEERAVLLERNRGLNWPDVTPEQRAFAYELLRNGYKHAAAAEEIGLARSAGIRLLRHPLVSAFIAELQEQEASHNFITKRFVESMYVDLLPKLLGEEEVPLVTPAGEQFHAKKFHSSEAVSVLRDLSKSSGYQETEGPKSATVNVTINAAAMQGSASPIDVELEVSDG